MLQTRVHLDCSATITPFTLPAYSGCLLPSALVSNATHHSCHTNCTNTHSTKTPSPQSGPQSPLTPTPFFPKFAPLLGIRACADA
eukprot:6207691-Pleurochrysis_carterae.AAC.3